MVTVLVSSPEKLRLFVAYSRIEFALKECGYVIPKSGVARADWVRFANEPCLQDVLEVAAVRPEVKEMVAKPPKVQITEGDRSWRWDEQAPQPITTLFEFFAATKQVRDNLFHGGKHGEDPRDDVLCRAAWIVLELCLERHHEVRQVFEGRY